ncbi:hypothetical protein ACS3SW_04075 [Roseobacteraceae bacterium S113]
MLRFEGQSALVVGAKHPVARMVAMALARHGAFVVAVDHDEDALMSLARSFPKRIEALSMSDGSGMRRAKLAQAWKGAPLHHMCCAPMGQLRGETWRAALFDWLGAFAKPLNATGGRALALFEPRESFGEEALLHRVERAADAAFIAEMHQRYELCLNGLYLHTHAAVPAAAARALMFLSPMSAGLSGALVPFGAVPPGAAIDAEGESA